MFISGVLGRRIFYSHTMPQSPGSARVLRAVPTVKRCGGMAIRFINSYRSGRGLVPLLADKPDIQEIRFEDMAYPKVGKKIGELIRIG